MSTFENIRPPSSGFKKFILYREPYETQDLWIIFNDEDYESYKVNINFLRNWLLDLYNGDTHFVNLLLDHFWNMYHVELESGVLRINTLPLSQAYRYNLGGDGLSVITKLVNRAKKSFFDL